MQINLFVIYFLSLLFGVYILCYIIIYKKRWGWCSSWCTGGGGAASGVLVGVVLLLVAGGVVLLRVAGGGLPRVYWWGAASGVLVGGLILPADPRQGGEGESFQSGGCHSVRIKVPRITGTMGFL